MINITCTVFQISNKCSYLEIFNQEGNPNLTFPYSDFLSFDIIALGSRWDVTTIILIYIYIYQRGHWRLVRILASARILAPFTNTRSPDPTLRQTTSPPSPTLPKSRAREKHRERNNSKVFLRSQSHKPDTKLNKPCSEKDYRQLHVHMR